MIEKQGDLWLEYPVSARVITTNGLVKQDGAAVMGRGCALEASEKFGLLKYMLGDRIMKHGNNLHVFPLRQNNYIYACDLLIAFPVKHQWMGPADLELIRRSAAQLKDVADRLDLGKVVMPRPGCGSGGLRWIDVRSYLMDALGPLGDDRFIVMHRPGEE